MLAGALAGLGTAGASASSCVSQPGPQPPSPGTAGNGLNGVTVLTACDAWAVGSFDAPPARWCCAAADGGVPRGRSPE